MTGHEVESNGKNNGIIVDSNGGREEKNSMDNKVRFFGHDGYRERAACICVRNEHENEVLLITSHRDYSLWTIPGGGIEPNESSKEAAQRELLEEAGVQGRVLRGLGSFENFERKNRTTVYVVQVEEEKDEWDEKRLIGRQRRWFRLSDAFALVRLHKPSQLTFLQHFIDSSPHSVTLKRLAEEMPSIHDCSLR